MPRTPTSKNRSYLAELISKAWEDVELPEVIAEAIGGMAIAFFEVRSGLAEGSQMKELIFECVGCAILVPFLAFLLRVIFVTPAKLYREIAEKTQRSKTSEINILPPKESHMIGILLAILSLLVLILIIQSIPSAKKEAQKQEIASLKPPPETIIPSIALTTKPLPMAAIPAPELVQPVATQKVEQTEAKVFEQDFMPTNDSGLQGELEKIREKQRIQEINDKKAAQKAVDAYWKDASPYYNQAILSLRDILRQRGATNGEVVETHPPPMQFLQCLPASISREDIDKNFGEIKLSKNTNLDFTISILGTSDEQRMLKISCGSGYLIIHPHAGQFYWRIKTLGVDDIEIPCSCEEAKQKIVEGLTALIEGQADYLSQTNK